MNSDSLVTLDWVSLCAMAVNEENASGGRIVTAPSNGAAGIIPAVLRYFADSHPSADSEHFRRFLLTAAAIGILYKKTPPLVAQKWGAKGRLALRVPWPR